MYEQTEKKVLQIYCIMYILCDYFKENKELLQYKIPAWHNW